MIKDYIIRPEAGILGCRGIINEQPEIWETRREAAA